jgi:hypothetical protein
LKKNPLERLGCGDSGSIDDIINHYVFQNINWKRIETKLEVPPFIPVLNLRIDNKLRNHFIF